MHFIYMVVMLLYIKEVYIDYNMGNQGVYSILLIIGVVYPTWYDSLQLYKIGPKAYFSDLTNYNDLVYTWGSLINLYLQNFSDPQNLSNKIIMTFLLLMQLLKSFFFLRIFDKLSPIVTMINAVVKDLEVLIVFFFMLIIIFGMIFAVIGVGNTTIPGGFREYSDRIDAHNEEQNDILEVPSGEYKMIGLFWGNMVATLRMSLGDFDFNATEHLTVGENYLFWLTWLLVVLMTCIVFLNFIIAEASNSY